MSEVLLCCPLPGPPPEYSGDCGTCRTYAWTGNEVGEEYFFLPYENGKLIGFEFTGITNNGSNIQVELYYCSDGVCQVWETWNLGQLASPTKKYAIIDFGSNPVYNSFELRFTTTNGTGGSLIVCLDCEVDVMLAPFCTGFTYNQAICDCTGDTVTLYTEFIKELPFEFPLNLSGYTWYLDPELQTPAPCGDYMYQEKMIFTYNCNNSSSVVKHQCGCDNIKPCSATTKFDQFQHTTFVKPNPYLPGVDNPPNNGNYLYSEQCLVLTLTNETPQSGYFELTFNYTGNPDTVVVTISDPIAPTGTAGSLSFSYTEPPTSMMLAVDELRTIPVASTGTTIWATWPPSRTFYVRVLAGYKLNSSNRAPVTTRVSWYDCGISINGYVVGLHTYSAWDSIVNPKLTTVVYAMSGNPYTWTVGTPLFADRRLTQPAFPYFYGYSGTVSNPNQIVIKVGEYYRREWGTKKYYVASQLKLQNKWEKRIDPYKRYDRFDVNNEYRVENCIDPVMSVGRITSITPAYNVLQPEAYYYLMGKSNYGASNEGASNNDYFFRTDFLTVRSKKGEKIPLTGYEHALWKSSEALAVGSKQYMLSFDDDQRIGEVLRKRNSLWGKIIAYGAGVITLAAAIFAAIVDPVGFVTTLVGFVIGKVIENNYKKSAPLPSLGLGILVKNLFGNNKVVQKAGFKVLGKKGAEKVAGAGNRPLQKLWHNLFHRHRKSSNLTGGQFKGGCFYDGCPPKDAGKVNVKQAAASTAFSLALMGFERLYTKGYTRTYREQCAEFYGRFTTTPYIDAKPTQFLYKFSGLTGTDSSTHCDGGYIYNNTSSSPNYVQFKKTAYKTMVKKTLFKKKTTKIPTILPDIPNFVTDIGKLIFLPYVSGRPYKYYGSDCDSIDCGPNFDGRLYGNNFKDTAYFTPLNILGELNNPLPITVEVPENYFFSNVSQEDADNKATEWLASLTAATYNQDSSGENKAGTTDESLNFSHRLENMEYPASSVICYLDEANTGISVGTKIYYDYDGVFSCLSGYYSTIEAGNTFYRKFYEVNSGGTVIDIWTQQNSNDTYATSQQTSQTATTVSVFSGYTSAWLFTGEDYLDTIFTKEYNNHDFNETWATNEFYNSPYVCRGFMDNVGDNLFYLYNDNLDINQGYALAPYKFYKEIDSTQIFNYIGDYLITIDIDQVCSPTGTTGVMFTLKDVSGNTVPSIFGLTFNAELSYLNTGNTIYQITFTGEEYQYFLELDPIYQGNITDVSIVEYLSPQAYNTVVFTGGTFTPCGSCELDGYAEYVQPSQAVRVDWDVRETGSGAVQLIIKDNTNIELVNEESQGSGPINGTIYIEDNKLPYTVTVTRTAGTEDAKYRICNNTVGVELTYNNSVTSTDTYTVTPTPLWTSIFATYASTPINCPV